MAAGASREILSRREEDVDARDEHVGAGCRHPDRPGDRNHLAKHRLAVPNSVVGRRMGSAGRGGLKRLSRRA
jgi:hypothetical protein